MKTNTILQVSAVIFAVVALLHLWRAIAGIPAQLGTWSVPIWLSWVAFVIAAFLAHTSWTAR
jgi:sterol desaturase/sphingolipid hydroxylase (fatty acid hydroxylase superfamily)